MMKKKDAIDQFRHMLKVYNKAINRNVLKRLVHGAIKDFNNSHPEMALTNEQIVSLSKRLGGLIYSDLNHNQKQVKKDEE